MQHGGGKAPFTWTLVGGEPPPGLTLSAEGTLTGTLASTVQAGQAHSFTVQVMDAHGARAARQLLMRTWLPPALTPTPLTSATEGVTYLKAPHTPEQLQGREGRWPLRFSATGLPAGLGLDPHTGTLYGIPLPGSAGDYSVEVELSDSNGKTFRATRMLSVVAARPLAEEGVVGDVHLAHRVALYAVCGLLAGHVKPPVEALTLASYNSCAAVMVALYER